VRAEDNLGDAPRRVAFAFLANKAHDVVEKNDGRLPCDAKRLGERRCPVDGNEDEGLGPTSWTRRSRYRQISLNRSNTSAASSGRRRGDNYKSQS
jgi:hypothetical protein